VALITAKRGQYNFVSYENKEVDRLFGTGAPDFSQKTKTENLPKKIHKILGRRPAVHISLYRGRTAVIHKRFIGPEVAPLGIGWNFREWYVPKANQKYTLQVIFP